MLFDRLGSGWATYKEQLGRARALVVDDEDFVRFLMRDLLVDEGFEVDLAHTAEMAWKLLGERNYDLLVADKNLPAKSGVELIRDVGEAKLDIPSVIITGYASVESISEALRVGAADYIAKPFDDIMHAARRLKSVADRRVAQRFYTRIIADLQEAMASGADREDVVTLGRELFAFKENLAKRLPALLVDQAPREEELVRKADGSVLRAERVPDLDMAREQLAEPDGPLVVVLSLELAGSIGLIREARAADPLVEFLVTSRAPNLTLSLEAVAAGAADFVSSAEGGAVLRARTRRLVETARRQRLNLYLISSLYRRVKEIDQAVTQTLLDLLPPEQRGFLDAEAAPPEESLPQIDVDISDLFATEEETGPAVPEPSATPDLAGEDPSAGPDPASPDPATLAEPPPGAPPILDLNNLEHVTRLVDLGQAAAELVHELRNPLAGIKSSAQLIVAKPDVDPSRHAAVILSQVQRLETLAERVAEYSRGERPGADQTICDLNATIERAIALLGLDRQRLVGLYRDLDPHLPQVKVDPIGLEQIFVNLLDNARGAVGKGGGRILIRTTVADGDVQAFVEDNGPGVPADARDQIFTPFVTTKKTGTGLGLHVSRRIAQRADGDLELMESRTGAVFRLRLPIHLG